MGAVVPYIPMITSVVSSGLGIAGQVQQAQQQAAQAQYQSAVARINQQVAQAQAAAQQQAAAYALQKGAADEQAERYQTTDAIGRQRAAMAAQGGDIDSGSPVDIVGDTAAQGELGALNIENNAKQTSYNASMQAQGSLLRADAAGLQAEMYGARGDNAMNNLPLSLLGGR